MVIYLRVMGEAVERARLAGLLWPNAETATARRSCDKAIERIRNATTAELIKPSGAGKIQCGPRLACDSDVLQLADFPLSVGLAALVQTANPFLDGFSVDSAGWRNWAGREENRLSVRRNSIWSRVLSRAMEQKNWEAVDTLGGMLFAQSPAFGIEQHVLLIRALEQAQRPAAALDHIERLIGQYEREELGIPTEVVRLRTTIRTAQATTQVPLPKLYDWDVFLAAPMAALASEYEQHRSDAMEIVRGLGELGCRRIYYAGIDRRTTDDFEEHSAALALNHRALQRSRIFILLHPARTQSSTLVEAGIALNLGIPFFLFARDYADLPFLLQGRNTPNLVASTYRSAADVISFLQGHRSILLEE